MDSRIAKSTKQRKQSRGGSVQFLSVYSVAMCTLKVLLYFNVVGTPYRHLFP